MSDPAISVVMPVYNGERYIRKTLASLSKQAFRDFEVLLIDDCSTDDSFRILQEHSASDNRFRTVRSPSNLGSAYRAINSVLPSLKGSFFVYSSQDDLFSEDWLEQMYSRALETGADAVVPDVEFYHPDRPINNRLEGIRGDRSRIIDGREAVELSIDWTIPGNALYKSGIVQKHGFPDLGAFSDEYAVRVFYLHCDLVAFSPGTFFYRQDNPDAITKKFSLNSFDEPEKDIAVFRLLVAEGFSDEICKSQMIRAMRRTIYLARRLAESSPGAGSSHKAMATEKLQRYLREFQSGDFKKFYRSSARRFSPQDKAVRAICSNGTIVFFAAASAAVGLQAMQRR